MLALRFRFAALRLLLVRLLRRLLVRSLRSLMAFVMGWVLGFAGARQHCVESGSFFGGRVSGGGALWGFPRGF